MKEGIYETEYGNACYVGGPHADRAWDLDMAEEIPIELVSGIWIREAKESDKYLFE